MDLQLDFPTEQVFTYDLNKVYEYDTFITKAKEEMVGYATKFNNSKDSFNFIINNIYDERMLSVKEYFYILFLNKANKVIGMQKISEGGIDQITVDIRLIAKGALDVLATGVILIHNHPSGNINPSTADEHLTKKIKSGLNLLDIMVMDHIIVTKNSYFSFADEGKL